MNIVVYTEHAEGTFKKSALEALSYAARMAAKNNGQAIALVIGNAPHAELGKYGADKIVSVKNTALDSFVAETYAKAIANVASSESAAVVVLSNTYAGKALAPRVAAQLKAAIASGVISQPETGSGFKVRRAVFSGKAFADVELKTAVKVLALTPNTFDVLTNEKSPAVVETDGAVSTADAMSQSLELSRTTGKIVLTEAEVVVSGGRGLKGPENWHLVEDLAQTLGAATACSKPVADMHWRPHEEHVGQTGITIKPNLYIAVGISGAIQHLAGVSSSKVIVAINKDPEAPFFKAADYGIVGDAFEVMPKLIEAAKAVKG